jgi:hypothetical protein
MACVSSHDECIFGATIKTRSEGTSITRRASVRVISAELELILDVNESVCSLYGTFEKASDLAHAWPASDAELRPRDAGAHVAGVDRHGGGPVLSMYRLKGFRMTSGGYPSGRRELTKRFRSFAVDHALDIVER